MEESRRHSGRRFVNVVPAVLVAVLVVLVAAGCGGGGQEAQGQVGERTTSGGQTNGTQRTTGETTEQEDTAETTGREDGAESTEPEEGANGGGREEPRMQASLEMAGEPGTAFSGKCVLGDEENDVSGQVPETFTYQLDGRKLDCEVRKEGSGNMKIIFTAGNDRGVYQTNAPDSTVKLTYTKNGLTSTTSSSSGSSVNQQRSSSRSSSSSSSSQSSSSSSSSP